MTSSSRAAIAFFTILCALPVLTHASETDSAERAIEQLMIRYAHSTDAFTRGETDRDSTLVAYGKIFTPDAAIGLKDQMTFTGPAAWLQLVATSSNALEDSQHLIGSQYVVWETGFEAAQLTSYLLATQLAKDGSVSRIVGTYRARAVQLGGAWRFDELMLDLMVTE